MSYNYISIKKIEVLGETKYCIDWDKTTGFAEPDDAPAYFNEYDQASEFAYFCGIPLCWVITNIGNRRLRTKVRTRPIKTWGAETEAFLKTAPDAREDITFETTATRKRKGEDDDNTTDHKKVKTEDDTVKVPDVFTQTDN